MKVLLAGVAPKGTKNATDGFIVEGCRVLLREAFPGVEIVEGRVPNGKYAGDYYGDIKALMKDCVGVFVVGSPWFWCGDLSSPKHQNLIKLLNAADSLSLPTTLMGGGSCFNLDFDIKQYALPDTFKRLKKVLVRDELAAGLSSEFKHLPCPAYFNDLLTPQPPSYNVLVWADPLNTISHQWWRHPKRRKLLEAEYKRARQFASQPNTKVAVTVKSARADTASWKRIGGREEDVIVVSTPQEAADMYSKARQMLSYRVHAAVPAQAAGISVDLVALDTRATTLKRYTKNELNLAREKWVEEIREAVNG